MLAQEHRIYPQAVEWFCAGRLTITAQGTVLLKNPRALAGALIIPAPER